MKTAIDTNILAAIWLEEPYGAAAASALGQAQVQGNLCISPIVYTESFAHPVWTEVRIHDFLTVTGISIDLTVHEITWREAGRRFARFAARRRRSGAEGQPRRLPADFLIGAHALLQADRLITLDVGFYQRNYPELELLSVVDPIL